MLLRFLLELSPVPFSEIYGQLYCLETVAGTMTKHFSAGADSAFAGAFAIWHILEAKSGCWRCTSHPWDQFQANNVGHELWKGKPQFSHEAQIIHSTNRDSAPQMRIIQAALQGWSCWEWAAQPFSANESLRKERPRSGDPLTARSYLRICTSPSSQGNEFIWHQKHHHQPPLIQHFCWHPEPHLSEHLGRSRVWRSFPDVGSSDMQPKPNATQFPGQTDFSALMPIFTAVP